MTAATKATGHGASITFGTSALAFHWRKIGKCVQSRGKVEDSDLSNADGLKTYLPEDLAEPGECEVEFVFDPTETLPDISALVPETITVTGPVPIGGSTADDAEGTGFITEITVNPEYTSNGLQVGTLKFAWDGKTPVVRTAAA